MKKLKDIALEDIALYKLPSDPLYSPEGKSLAFQVTRADADKNCYHTDVFLAQNGEARQVTWSLDASIVLWQDENTLILRRKDPDGAEGTTALYRLSLLGGEAQPWLTLPFPLRSMTKLGAGYVALGTIDAADPDAYLDSAEERKKKAEAKKEEADYQVVDEVPYWFNGAGFTNGKRAALFLVSEKDGQALCRRITEPYFAVGSYCAEGNTVYYAGNLLKGKMSMYDKVYAYDAGTKKTAALYRKQDHSVGGLFVMDGALYGRASDMKRYGVNQTSDLCRIEKDSITPVYEPEVSLYSSVLGDTAEGGNGDRAVDGAYLTLATVDDHNAIYAFTAGADGAFSKATLWEQPGMLCSMDAGRKKIAVIYQDWQHAAEVFEMNRDGSGMTQVTHLNDEALAGRYIAFPNRLDYTSCGYDLHGWVLLPQGFDRKKKYPAVLDIHGGPRCAYGETFFHEMQLWAARGYVVFFTNIKGSDGRGDAFADIRDDYGVTDYQNLMDFTDAVLAAYPNIDPARLCETGGSYGGFMTNWIIGHTNRFCCAASQRSISNWVSFGFISDIGGFFAPDQNGAKGMFGPANTEILWNHSPLKYADKVRTPTLFIHSDEDYRCPQPEGMQMMQALAQRGVETRMCIFHGENHELSRSGKPRNRIKRMSEITDWMKQYLMEEHKG